MIHHVNHRSAESEARHMIDLERSRIEEHRTEFIAEICRQYRGAGDELRIETPVNSVNKHLFVRRGTTWHADCVLLFTTA